MRIIKKSIYQPIRTRNTELITATKLENIQDRLTLIKAKFLLRAIQHEYTSNFITNLNSASNKSHPLSIINRFESIENEKLRLFSIIDETQRRITQNKEPTNISERLSTLLHNPQKNRLKIFELIKVFEPTENLIGFCS